MEGGQSWSRLEVLGRGSYSTVSLAKSKTARKRRSHDYPALMAVKSAEISDSATLQKEREVLEELHQCPNIIRCYGEEFTDEKNGAIMVYNLLLEYASGGTLAKVIKNSIQGRGGLPEYEIRRYTRSILRGLMYTHRKGYVHLDIKPQNILLVPSSNNKMRKRKTGFEFHAKIADFGLARRVGTRSWRDNNYLTGTPQYMSPEAITHYKQGPAVDIWALGCVVAEMVTGKPVFSRNQGEDIDDFLYKPVFRMILLLVPSLTQ